MASKQKDSATRLLGVVRRAERKIVNHEKEMNDSRSDTEWCNAYCRSPAQEEGRRHGGGSRWGTKQQSVAMTAGDWYRLTGSVFHAV